MNIHVSVHRKFERSKLETKWWTQARGIHVSYLNLCFLHLGTQTFERRKADSTCYSWHNSFERTKGYYSNNICTTNYLSLHNQEIIIQYIQRRRISSVRVYFHSRWVKMWSCEEILTVFENVQILGTNGGSSSVIRRQLCSPTMIYGDGITILHKVFIGITL